MKQYFVYMVPNKGRTTLYIGITNSLMRREFQHRQGEIPGFSKRRGDGKTGVVGTREIPRQARDDRSQNQNMRGRQRTGYPSLGDRSSVLGNRVGRMENRRQMTAPILEFEDVACRSGSHRVTEVRDMSFSVDKSGLALILLAGDAEEVPIFDLARACRRRTAGMSVFSASHGRTCPCSGRRRCEEGSAGFLEGWDGEQPFGL